MVVRSQSFEQIHGEPTQQSEIQRRRVGDTLLPKRDAGRRQRRIGCQRRRVILSPCFACTGPRETTLRSSTAHGRHQQWLKHSLPSTLMSPFGPSRPNFSLGPTSAFGAKRKWAARQSPLPSVESDPERTSAPAQLIGADTEGLQTSPMVFVIVRDTIRVGPDDSLH